MPGLKHLLKHLLKTRTTRSRWRLRRLRFEPTSRLRENQNKEKEPFFKIAS